MDDGLGQTTAPPTVSVVVPAHRMDPVLARCLDALERLDYPEDRREVLVVCDGVEPGRFFDGRDVQVIAAPKGGPARARNLGVRQAGGVLVAFTDSDCLVHRGWLTELTRCFDQGAEIAGAGGAQLSPDDEAPLGRAIQRFFVSISFIGGYTREHAQPTEVEHNPSCNAMYRKDALVEVGGFDEVLFPGEDLDLDVRLRQRGYRLMYNPAAVVRHYRPASVLGFARMMERYGRFSGGYLTRRHGFFRGISYLPLATAAAACATAALYVASPPAGAAWVLGLVVVLILFFWIKTEDLGQALACTGLLLVTLASWNLGFARGLVHFPDRGAMPQNALCAP